MQESFEKNYKMMNKIKLLHKLRYISHLWIGRLNIVKLLFCSILIYRFNAIAIKIPQNNFVDITN